MMSRAILLLGAFSLAGSASAQQPDKNAAKAERIRAIQRQVMDLEDLARTKVLRERDVKALPRLPVNTAYNVESFAPVTARFIRFTVLATVNGSEPCLDALEIYGPDSSENLNQGAWTAASSVHQQLGRFNHVYFKGWCWVSKEPGKGWVQVELPAPTKIARIVWSRDAENRYHDRIASAYRIEVSEDGRDWHTVATGADRAAPGHERRFSRVALLKGLDPAQQKQRQELMDELARLGAPNTAWRNELTSGPQVGEGINGRFATLFLNGDRGHAGKNRCPV